MDDTKLYIAKEFDICKQLVRKEISHFALESQDEFSQHCKEILDPEFWEHYLQKKKSDKSEDMTDIDKLWSAHTSADVYITQMPHKIVKRKRGQLSKALYEYVTTLAKRIDCFQEFSDFDLLHISTTAFYQSGLLTDAKNFTTPGSGRLIDSAIIKQALTFTSPKESISYMFSIMSNWQSTTKRKEAIRRLIDAIQQAESLRIPICEQLIKSEWQQIDDAFINAAQLIENGWQKYIEGFAQR